MAVALDGRVGVELLEQESDPAKWRRPLPPGGARIGWRFARGRALDLDAKAGCDLHDGARPEAPARAHHGVPDVRPAAPHEQDLGVAADLAAAEEAGGEDTAAIRHEEVPPVEELREVGEGAVGDGAGRALEHEQPRGVARHPRLLGDELRRQRVVVRTDVVARGIGGHHAPARLAQKSFFWGPLGDAESGTGRPRCS